MSTDTAAIDWRALPKVLLHEHLDGGLRPQAALELCRARGLATPADDAAALAAWVQANANSGSLGRYLAGFKLTAEAMPRCQAANAWPSKRPRTRWPTAACWPSSVSHRCCWKPSA